MNETESSSTPLTTKVLAAVVLIIAAWVLLHFVIHIAVAIASVVVFVGAVIAVIWAARVLF